MNLTWPRILACGVLFIASMFGLACLVYNGTAANEWQEVQAHLAAEGETIVFRATTREPVPEADNFCAIPILKNLPLEEDGIASKGVPAENRKRLEAFRKIQGSSQRFDGATLGKPTDVKAWADWLRKGNKQMPPDSGDPARDVLMAFANDAAIFEELATGLDRPKAQWIPEWKTRDLPPLLAATSVPHYQATRSLNVALTINAIAAMHAGDAQKAHQYTRVLARINEANLNDPLIIGLLVAAADMDKLCTLTWELCNTHTGSARDFQVLESDLARLDFRDGLLHAYRSEMASHIEMVQYLKRSGYSPLADPQTSMQGDSSKRLLRLGTPSGFFDASCAVFGDREFRYLIKPLRDDGWAAAFRAADDFEHEFTRIMEEKLRHPSWLMASIMIPATTTLCYRAAYTQTLTAFAITACALERHYIEHGSYPDSLDSVKLSNGKPLPLDPITGKALGYRKSDNGKYSLWSVGFDGKDDGGTRVLATGGPEKTKFHVRTYTGDWVWDFRAQ